MHRKWWSRIRALFSSKPKPAQNGDKIDAALKAFFAKYEAVEMRDVVVAYFESWFNFPGVCPFVKQDKPGYVTIEIESIEQVRKDFDGWWDGFTGAATSDFLMPDKDAVLEKVLEGIDLLQNM